MVYAFRILPHLTARLPAGYGARYYKTRAWPYFILPTLLHFPTILPRTTSINELGERSRSVSPFPGP